jgi:hypothetical protein
VIIETRDFRAGDVRVPALIRYYEPEFDAYEVSVLLHPYKDAPADMDDLRWWTVKAHEIVANLGPAVTERPHKKMSGERVWRSFIFAPEEEL